MLHRMEGFGKYISATVPTTSSLRLRMYTVDTQVVVYTLKQNIHYHFEVQR